MRCRLLTISALSAFVFQYVLALALAQLGLGRSEHTWLPAPEHFTSARLEHCSCIPPVDMEGAERALHARALGVDWWSVSAAQNRLLVVTAGWPLRSVHGEAWTCCAQVGRNGPACIRTLRGSGTREAEYVSRLSVLPVRPLLIGTLVNAFTIAACSFAARSAYSLARQRSRRWRGRCTGCGHQLAGNLTCPECGKQAA